MLPLYPIWVTLLVGGIVTIYLLTREYGKYKDFIPTVLVALLIPALPANPFWTTMLFVFIVVSLGAQLAFKNNGWIATWGFIGVMVVIFIITHLHIPPYGWIGMVVGVIALFAWFNAIRKFHKDQDQ